MGQFIRCGPCLSQNNKEKKQEIRPAEAFCSQKGIIDYGWMCWKQINRANNGWILWKLYSQISQAEDRDEKYSTFGEETDWISKKETKEYYIKLGPNEFQCLETPFFQIFVILIF